MTKQCPYQTKCHQDKEIVCTNNYEHCIIYKRFETLKTPADKAPAHTAKLGVQRFREKYPDFNLEGVTYDEWLSIGSLVELPSEVKSK